MENFEETEETNALPENETPVEQPEIKLIVTEDIRSYLYDMAKWTKFLGIFGFVISALLVMCAFGATAFIAFLSKYSPGTQMGSLGAGFIMVYFIFLALLYFYPSLMLFKHATAAQKAVLFGDQLSLSASMSNLKSFFKFWGILLIVLIAMYVLIFVFAGIAGIAGTAIGGH